MKRRTILLGTAGAAAILTMPKPAIAQNTQNKRVLRMVTAWPQNFPGLASSAQRLARAINLASNGSLTVKVYNADELVPVAKCFDAVAQNEAEMYHAVEYYWEEKSKAFNFFASMPFGMTATETDAWLTLHGGQKLWNALSGKFNIKPFAAGNTGMQMGGWYNREINSLEDLKGLNVRMLGLGGKIMRQLGAKTSTLPSNQIVSALKSGKLDATEWVGPWIDMALGLHKAARYYYWPGFQEPGTIVSLGINLDVWHSLSPRLQTIIELACRTENRHMLADFNKLNAMALSSLMRKHRVALRRYPEDALQEFGRLSGQAAKSIIKGDEFGQRIYDSYVEARAYLSNWAKYSGESYLVARRLPFSYDARNRKKPKPIKKAKEKPLKKTEEQIFNPFVR